MTGFRVAVCVLMCSVMVEGCSSRPREFTPRLASPPASQAEFDSVYATCQQLLVKGKLDAHGRAASAGVGATAGVGTAVAGGATAAAVGGWGGVALASATIVLLPFAVLGGAWGMSRAKRAKKERAIKTALEGCMHERGYDVVAWDKSGKKVAVRPTSQAR